MSVPSPNDETWRSILIGDEPWLRQFRDLFKHLPSDPRCKMCLAPFAGPGGLLMRRRGKVPYRKNPSYCGECFTYITDHRGGAEIECSLLFADVRGSTSLAEAMAPAAFRTLMDRFFEVAAHVLVEHDAIVDKFVGDEVIGIFIPVLAQEHAAQAIAAARDLLAALGYGGAGDPWLPVGVGVHTGVAYVGSVGSASHVDLTAMGDPVNVAARLASTAGAGEILVSLTAAEAAGSDTTGLERRELSLKGKSEATSVVVLAA
jgi:adenylate cyclase